MHSRKKSSFLHIISSKLFIATSIAVLIFLGASLTKEVIRRRQISTRINNLKEQIKELENSSVELSNLIEYLKSEEYQEKEARLKLGMKKPGEKVIVIPSSNEDILNDNQNSLADNIGEENISNWRRWWNYFFKK